MNENNIICSVYSSLVDAIGQVNPRTAEEFLDCLRTLPYESYEDRSWIYAVYPLDLQAIQTARFDDHTLGLVSAIAKGEMPKLSAAAVRDPTLMVCLFWSIVYRHIYSERPVPPDALPILRSIKSNLTTSSLESIKSILMSLSLQYEASPNPSSVAIAIAWIVECDTELYLRRLHGHVSVCTVAAEASEYKVLFTEPVLKFLQETIAGASASLGRMSDMARKTT